MVKRKRALLIFLITCLLVGCGELDIANLLLPIGKSADNRVSESLLWNRQHGVDTLMVPTSSYRFYVCSDIHAEDYPRRFAEFVRRERNDNTAFFYLMLGDAISHQDAQDIVYRIMFPDTCEYDPGYTIVGNHDVFFGNWEQWVSYFHTSTYYFFVRTPDALDFYVMLDTANGTLGEEQTKWLKQVLGNVRPQCQHCIVCLHSNLLKTDHNQFMSGNLSLEETYFLLDLFAKSRVELVLQGHDHHRDETSFNGVCYVTLDDLKDITSYTSYIVVEMGTSINYQFFSIE